MYINWYSRFDVKCGVFYCDYLTGESVYIADLIAYEGMFGESCQECAG